MTHNNLVAISSADAAQSWTPITADSQTFSGTLIIASGNSGTISIRSTHNPSSTADLAAGTQIQLVRVDLSTIEIQASAASQAYQFVGDDHRGPMG